MKLLNNLFLFSWAVVQWIIMLFLLAPIAGWFVFGIAIAFDPTRAVILPIWAVVAVTCWTYRKSGFFWATPLKDMGE